MLEKLLDISRDVEFSIDGDNWKFQLLRPTEKLRRAQVISRVLGGSPIESVTADDYSRAFMIATLTVSFVDGPEVFKEKFQKDFTQIPDDNYIKLLYEKYLSAEERFEEAKKKFRPA